MACKIYGGGSRGYPGGGYGNIPGGEYGNVKVVSNSMVVVPGDILVVGIGFSLDRGSQSSEGVLSVISGVIALKSWDCCWLNVRIHSRARLYQRLEFFSAFSAFFSA